MAEYERNLLTTAKFIGEDNSEGFRNGRKYAIDIQEQFAGGTAGPGEASKIVVRHHYGDEFYAYDDAAAFEANWELLGPDVAPDALTTAVPVEPKNKITIRDTKPTTFLDPNLYVQMKALANDLIKSKAIPKCWETAEQVFVGLQTGLEMGMTPMEAMNSLYVVNGAVNVWGKATTRRLKVHDWDIEYSDESQETCTATITKGDKTYTATMTFADAEASKYTTDNSGKLKIGWRPGVNRIKKLRYGALSMLISGYVPEVLGSAAGIVEVSEDFELADENPKLLKAEDRKVKMQAAADKHKQLTGAKFMPKAVEASLDKMDNEESVRLKDEGN